MKFLIFSDSHGMQTNMLTVMGLHRAEIAGCVDGVIFCGDGLTDIERIKEKYPLPAYYAVRGNCDLFGCVDYPDELYICPDGVGILIYHGHRMGENTAIARAGEKGASVVISGHTHAQTCEYLSDEKLWLFNPGSITRPRYGIYPTYGVLEIRNGRVLLSHGKID